MYGIRVPKTRREALAIDKENGNNLWSDNIKKEMQNVAPEFKLKAKDGHIGNKYKLVGFYNMVCDIKMDFTWKLHIVSNRHRVPDSAVCTYSGVVSRESIHIVLTYPALMEIEKKRPALATYTSKHQQAENTTPGQNLDLTMKVTLPTLCKQHAHSKRPELTSATTYVTACAISATLQQMPITTFEFA